MKYHSLYWWKEAFKDQLKHYIRNIICRKWMKIDFGYTKPDLFSLYIEDNQEMLYQAITHKYPKLTTIKKYMIFGRAFTVTEFNCAGAFYYTNKTISVFWTTEGTISDILFLLSKGIAVSVNITNVLNCPHTITVVGYDENTNSVIYNDPLGDPFLKYTFVYGYNISTSISNFHKLTGTLIRLDFILNRNKFDIIPEVKKIFEQRLLYSLEPSDYDRGALLESSKFTFMKYTKDGTLNLNVDLGKEARNKFIFVYGEYRSTKNSLWDDQSFDIMAETRKYRVIKPIKT